MPFDIFDIFIEPAAEQLLGEFDAETAALFRALLVEECQSLQNTALECSKAAVPVKTFELQGNIVKVHDGASWKIQVLDDTHVNSDQPISSSALALELDGDSTFVRSTTNPGFGAAKVGQAAKGSPTEDWITIAQDTFCNLAGV